MDKQSGSTVPSQPLLSGTNSPPGDSAAAGSSTNTDSSYLQLRLASVLSSIKILYQRITPIVSLVNILVHEGFIKGSLFSAESG